MSDAPTMPDLERLSKSELIEYSQRLEQQKKRCELRMREIDQLMKKREG